MSRRNKKAIFKNGEKNETKNKFFKLLIGLIAIFSFFQSIREFNNFTIISFKLLVVMFFLSGILISYLVCFLLTNKKKKIPNFYNSFAIKILTYGSIFCALFFITNEYLSTKKEYTLNSRIYEKHKAYGRSPNYIITQIKGLEREINIHNYEFEDLIKFDNVQIKIKKGFWGFDIIKEIKLTK